MRDVYQTIEDTKQGCFYDEDNEILRCPDCQSSNITEQGNYWECNACGNEWRKE